MGSQNIFRSLIIVFILGDSAYPDENVAFWSILSGYSLLPKYPFIHKLYIWQMQFAHGDSLE